MFYKAIEEFSKIISGFSVTDERSMRNIEEVRRKVQRRELKLDVVGNIYRAEAA